MMESSPEKVLWCAVLLRYLNDMEAVKSNGSDPRKKLHNLVDELYRPHMNDICSKADIDYKVFCEAMEKKLASWGYYDKVESALPIKHDVVCTIPWTERPAPIAMCLMYKSIQTELQLTF